MKITTNVNNKLVKYDVEKASKFKYEGSLMTTATRNVPELESVINKFTQQYTLNPAGYMIVVHPDLLFNAPSSRVVGSKDWIKTDVGTNKAKLISTEAGVQFANPNDQRDHNLPALLPFLAHFTPKPSSADIPDWSAANNTQHTVNTTNVNVIPSWSNAQLKTMLASKLLVRVLFEYVDINGDVDEMMWWQELTIFDILIAMSQGNLAFSYDDDIHSSQKVTWVPTKTAKAPFHLVETLKGYRWILGSNYVFNQYYGESEQTIKNKLNTIAAQLNEISDQLPLTEFVPGSSQTEHFIEFNHWGTNITTPIVSYILKPKDNVEKLKNALLQYQTLDETKFIESLDKLFEDFFGKNIRVKQDLIPYIVKIIDESGLDVTTSTTIFPIK